MWLDRPSEMNMDSNVWINGYSIVIIYIEVT